jgi:hypothetical protein
VKDFPWRDKTISLVGNASSLWEGHFGPQIDEAECVIRINQGAFIQLYPESTGVKDPGQISIFGFDFWGSPTTYTGKIKAAPHDPEAEENFVRGAVKKGRVFQVGR